jgi:hypothetical protein
MIIVLNVLISSPVLPKDNSIDQTGTFEQET